MVNIGFIGYGSMGSMLLTGFLESKIIQPEQVVISTRTRSKLEKVQYQWPGLRIISDNSSVVDAAELIFICVKPFDFKDILEEIKHDVSLDKHIVSTVGLFQLASIEKIVSAKISKLMPSLVSEIREGISLICHNKHVTRDDACYLQGLLASISTVKTVEERDFELATEITSCGPGFIATIFDEFIKSAIRHNSTFQDEEIESMVIETLFGSARLFKEKQTSFSDTINRVATKGGLTEQGVYVLRRELPYLFDAMLDQVLSKHRELVASTNREFN